MSARDQLAHVATDCLGLAQSPQPLGVRVDEGHEVVLVEEDNGLAAKGAGSCWAIRHFPVHG